MNPSIASRCLSFPHACAVADPEHLPAMPPLTTADIDHTVDTPQRGRPTINRDRAVNDIAAPGHCPDSMFIVLFPLSSTYLPPSLIRDTS